MKTATLILTLVCGIALSSCCCQSDPMPKLRPIPKQKVQPMQIIVTDEVLPVKDYK